MVESRMKTFGQLIHVEDISRGDTRYRLAVFRVTGGLQAKWSCEACALDETLDRTCTNLDECVSLAMDTIERHHAAKHTGG